MRYAILSDVHANESALQHVLEDAAAQGVEQIICLGDVVGYGPLPVETVALVRRSAAMTLAGNHDDAVSGRQDADAFIDLAGDAVKRHRAALPSEDLAWLKELPYTCGLEGAIAAHGDFTEPSNFHYIDDEEGASANFAATDAQLMFVGHTHVPGLFLTGHSGTVYRVEPQDFTLEDGKRYIVNPGSVGYPRENNGTCHSSYVLYDSSARTVTFRFLPFAVSSVLQRGVAPRRRTSLVVGLVALIVGLAVAGTYVAFRPSATLPSSVGFAPKEDLTLEQKSVTLLPTSRFVCANLKVDRKGDPVDLRISFKSNDGELLGELTKTVKESSAARFKVPDRAVVVHFTLLRQQSEARPNVLTFNPTCQ